MEEQVAALESKLEAQSIASAQKFEELKMMMQSMKDSLPASRLEDRAHQPKMGYTPKLEFPKFDGTCPKMWIKKCGKYFSLCKISDDQKVDLASLNMTGKAEAWVASYLSGRSVVDWNDFVTDVNIRFKDETCLNVVEEFNKLEQVDSVESYVDSFENLKSIMLQYNYVLPNKYVLESFIGGLKPGIRPFVRAFKPQTINEAVEYARLQDESINLNKPTSIKQFSSKQYHNLTSPNSSKPPLLPNPHTKPLLTYP
uniref:Ty3 transposon capsid-like protein domain-containing protein n=1 Tax=Chenopodium quinoa TaxID=63459 RepID=A0A803M2N6_CHEQI